MIYIVIKNSHSLGVIITSFKSPTLNVSESRNLFSQDKKVKQYNVPTREGSSVGVASEVPAPTLRWIKVYGILRKLPGPEVTLYPEIRESAA